MQFVDATYPEGRPVDGYGPGFFRIGGAALEGAHLILPGGVAPWGGYDDLDRLIAAAPTIDVLFIGTGVDLAPIPSPMRRALETAGIGVEIMNTPTACRTFNVLLSEGRRIGLAALPV